MVRDEETTSTRTQLLQFRAPPLATFQPLEQEQHPPVVNRYLLPYFTVKKPFF